MIDGTVRVPGSKSVTHRALLLAATSARPCRLENPLASADTNATLGALGQLGYTIGRVGNSIEAQPTTQAAGAALNLENAGTGLRLLAAHAATIPGQTTFTGDASLTARPNGPLLDALRSGGASVIGGPQLPFTVSGPLQSGTFELPAKTSSQYASALLLALPRLAGDSTLRMEKPVSSGPYIELTCQVARAFGIGIRREDNAYFVAGGQAARAARFEVEGDWSSAAFPAVAAAITGGSVQLQGLRLDSLQGDKRILDILADFGANVQDLRVTGGALESPGIVDVAATPDMFPALCILAAASKGTTQFVGGGALRDKECDRIRAMAQGLAALGIEVSEAPDGLSVVGGPMGGGRVHCFDDHRIHMAFSVAALAASGPVELDGADSVAVSYPGFHGDLARLGGKQ